MLKFVVDRFEKGYAVLEREDGKLIDVVAAHLPKETKEGDSVELCDDGNYRINVDETSRRSDEVRNLKDKLF